MRFPASDQSPLSRVRVILTDGRVIHSSETHPPQVMEMIFDRLRQGEYTRFVMRSDDGQEVEIKADMISDLLVAPFDGGAP